MYFLDSWFKRYEISKFITFSAISFYFQEFGPRRFVPGRGLAHVTDQWGNGHGGKPRRPRPTGRFDRSGEARTGATGAVTDGDGADGAVVRGRLRPSYGTREMRPSTGSLERVAPSGDGHRNDVHDGDRRRPTATSTDTRI